MRTKAQNDYINEKAAEGWARKSEITLCDLLVVVFQLDEYNLVAVLEAEGGLIDEIRWFKPASELALHPAGGC